MVPAGFRALSSKIGDQEPFPCQTSGWIYLMGGAGDFNLRRWKRAAIRRFRVASCPRLRVSKHHARA